MKETVIKEQLDRKFSKKFLMAINLSSLLLFLVLLTAVLNNGTLLEVDRWVSTHIPAIQSPTLTKIVIFITDINGVVGSAILSFFLIGFLFVKKYYRDLQFYLISFLGASALFTVIKLLVERARPVLKIINEQGFSFPSGHSSMSMVIALMLYVIFVPKISSRGGRLALLLFTLSWPILIAFTRVYLNVHWVSDTLAGFTVGIFWVTLILLVMQAKRSRRSSQRDEV